MGTHQDTIQSPRRLYKAARHYTEPRQTIQKLKILDNTSNLLDRDLKCQTRVAININPNYLDTEHDQLVAADALRLARRLVLESKSFREKYIPSEHFPGLHIESDDDLAREAGNISTSIFHPVGTCKMGRRDDPMVRQLLCDIISYQQMALHVAHMYTTYRFIHVLFPCSVSSFSFCLTIC